MTVPKRFGAVATLDVAALFDPVSAHRDAVARAVAATLAGHGSFVATGFAGAEGVGGAAVTGPDPRGSSRRLPSPTICRGSAPWSSRTWKRSVICATGCSS